MAGIESLLVGRTLGGRYRIEEVIGRGGMGAVYRAVDERLGRKVAVKVITVSGTGDAEARERLRARFFREARSAAALPHHPNVVPVYDYGSDETVGLDYLVMELLRGSDLATRLQRTGPPPLAASLKILLEATRGVAVGHRQGLIHRDIKPGNIFLTEPHANEVQVRVVDFGIAKLADDDDTLAQLTQDGRVPHSPAYASPEQLRGLTQLTPASDVFSLGAVGYQLLTGERPYTEGDRNRLSLGMPVEPPSLRERNPAVPGSIEALIRRALAFDPKDRFADAGEMAADLERSIRSIGDMPVEPYLAGAAIVTAADEDEEVTRALTAEDDDRTRALGTAPEGPAGEDDRTLLAPPPQPAAAGREASRERIEAKPPPPPRRRQRRGIGGLFVWSLVTLVLVAAGVWAYSQMEGGQVSLDGAITPEDSLEIIIPEDPIEPSLEPGDPELEAWASNQEGRRFYTSGQYDSAVVHFERAVELSPLSPDYRRNYGLALLEVGRPDAAENQFERAIQLAPERSNAYESLSRAQLALGDTTGAIESLQDFIEREPDARWRRAAENQINNLRQLQQPRIPPLLGERVDTTAPAPDTLPQTTPVQVPPDTASRTPQ